MLGKHFPTGEENKGWGEMRLTTRELGLLLSLCGFGLLFGLNPFSALQMEEQLQLSPLKVFPGTLIVALTLTPLRSRAGKRKEPAAARNMAMQLP